MNDFHFGWTEESTPRPFIDVEPEFEQAACQFASVLFNVAVETQRNGESVRVLPKTWGVDQGLALLYVIDKLSALVFSACTLEVNEVQELSWFDKHFDEMAG